MAEALPESGLAWPNPRAPRRWRRHTLVRGIAQYPLTWEWVRPAWRLLESRAFFCKDDPEVRRRPFTRTPHPL